MNTANTLQQPVVKRLNAEAKPVDSAGEHDRQLVQIRSAGISLHRKLCSLMHAGNDVAPTARKRSI